MPRDPFSLFILLGAGACFATWLLVLINSHPAALARSQTWAGIAFWAIATQVFSLILTASRVTSDLGAEMTFNPRALVLGQLLDALAVLAALIAVLLPTAARLGRGRPVILALWAFAAVEVLAGAFGVQFAFPGTILMFALFVHALAVGATSWTVIVDWGRWILRFVTLVSVGSLIVAPEWAVSGQGFGGYDRSLFGIHRLMGITPVPGALAMLAAIALFLEVGVQHGKKSMRLIGGAAALLCIALAQSRTSWGVVVVGLLVLAAVRWPRVRVVGIAFGLLLLTLPVFRPQYFATDYGSGSRYISTLSGRIDVWTYATAEFHHHPLLGYGPAFLNSAYRQAYLPSNLQFAVHAHNQWMQSLGATGVIGVASLVLLVTAALLLAWRARPIDGGLSLALVVMLCGFGVTDVPLRPIGVVIFPALIVIALSATVARQAMTELDPGIDERGRDDVRPLVGTP